MMAQCAQLGCQPVQVVQQNFVSGSTTLAQLLVAICAFWFPVLRWRILSSKKRREKKGTTTNFCVGPNKRSQRQACGQLLEVNRADFFWPELFIFFWQFFHYHKDLIKTSRIMSQENAVFESIISGRRSSFKILVVSVYSPRPKMQ